MQDTHTSERLSRKWRGAKKNKNFDNCWFAVIIGEIIKNRKVQLIVLPSKKRGMLGIEPRASHSFAQYGAPYRRPKRESYH